MRSLCIILLLCGPLAPALASDTPPLPPGGRFCDTHHVQCQRMHAERQAFCKDNPVTCAHEAEFIRSRTGFCRDHADTCRQLLTELRARNAPLLPQASVEDDLECRMLQEEELDGGHLHSEVQGEEPAVSASPNLRYGPRS